jgi:glycosyltransferase involved in cell wall biosynthesis
MSKRASEKDSGLTGRVLRFLLPEPRPGNGVVIVSRADLFPTDHGAAVRIVETARALGESGLSVGLVSDQNTHWYEYVNGEFLRRRYPFWLKLVCLPSPLAKLWHLSKDLPYSNSFLYRPMTGKGFFWRTLSVASKIRAGILQAEFPAYALPCIQVRERLDVKVILVEHNVEYERMRAQVKELTDHQYRKLKQLELDLCQQSDAVVCVSENDKQKLQKDGVAKDHLHVISHGVNLSDYDVSANAEVRKTFSIPQDSPVLVYHGTFSYPPNLEAINIFSEQLLPRLHAKGLDCHVLAIGKAPPVKSPHPNIHFTGSVERLAPFLKSADIAVVPLTDGGGTRLKIIECFAASLPVISTSKGIEGIPVEPGKQAIVVDDWNDMCIQIAGLWHQQERRRALAKAGAEFVQDFDWGEIAKRYRTLYSDIRA